MADNLTQITNAIANINATLNISTTDVLNTAITNSNEQTGGWVGIIIFVMMSLSVLVTIMIKKGNFGAFERSTVFLMSFAIILDLGVYLFKYSILTSLYLLIWLFTCYYVVVIFAFLKKELTGGEN